MEEYTEIPISQLIEALLDSDTLFPPRFLPRLSDLEPNELDALKEAWPRVPTWRRQALLEDIEALGGQDYLLSFTAFAGFHPGTLTGNLCSKRGRIVGMEPQGNAQVIKAMCPLASLFGYTSELRNATQGRASFTMHFEHYEAVPFSIAEAIIEEKRKKDKEKHR